MKPLRDLGAPPPARAGAADGPASVAGHQEGDAAAGGDAAPRVSQFVWHRERAQLDVDPLWLEAFGHSPGSVAAELALDWRTLVYTPDVPRIEAALAAARGPGNRVVDVEARVVSIDGTTRWFRLIARIGGWDADCPSCLIGTIENTTTQRVRVRDLQGQIAAIDRAQMVAEFDLDGRILHANDRFLAALGCTRADLVGRHHSMLVDPQESSSIAYREFWDRLGRGEYVSGRFRRCAQGGREIWIQATYNPVFDDRGRPFKVVKYATDISEEQRRQADLEGQLRVIHRAQIMVEIGLDGRIRTANLQALRAFGYELPDLWSQPHSVLVAPEDRQSPEYRDLWASLLRGEHAAGIFRRQSRNGRELWLQATYAPVLDPNGKPWKIVEYAVDVTDEVMRRADMQGQIDAIARTQCVVEYDLTGRVLRANERFLGMMGYRLDEVLGMSHRIFVSPEEAAGQDYREFWASLAAGQVAHGEFRRRRRDGSTIWISGTYHPILDPRGRPIKVVKYCADATDRVATQQALRDSEAKLRGLFELSPAGIALIDDAAGTVLEANDALAAMLGVSMEGLVGRRLEDYLLAPAADGRQSLLAPVGPGARLAPREVVLRGADGRRRAALLSGMRTVDPEGRSRTWGIIQDISDRKAVEQELERAAMTDSLTGLPNRAAFAGALGAALERLRADPGARFALLLLDFDRFKFVNDTLGHAAGDQLLCHIGDRLRSKVRMASRDGAPHRAGLAARLGGDEFAVLLADVRDEGDVEIVVRRLLDTLSEPYALQGRQIFSSASIGVVIAEDASATVDELMQRADVAMYEAKHGGRNRAARFDDGMQLRLRRRLDLEDALRVALAERSLRVAYQPIVDLSSGTIEAAEALVRWRHPTLGEISPAEFVPVAEDANLIVPLGALVLRSACEDFLAWQAADPARAPRRVSVNLSRKELTLGKAYVEHLESVLRETGMPPECLVLEVTEREIMRNPTLSQDLMKRLKALGVRLAMDDFGTGASSLSCLRDYPFDLIKVDRSFLGNLESQQDVMMVLHATVTLVENLGMVSVAEGVERTTQVAILQTVGCRYGQGFLFSPAVAAADLLSVDPLKAWSRHANPAGAAPAAQLIRGGVAR